MLHELAQKMGEIKAPYAVCGGIAMDLFIGHKTRPHKDLDVAVFWEDRDWIVQQMLQQNWLLFEPCGCKYLHKISCVTGQKKIKSNIWCVRKDNPHYQFTEHKKEMFAVVQDDCEQTELDFIEFLFNDRKDGCFLYAKNHAIQLPLSQAVQNAQGIPYLAPELVLLYKAADLNNPDYRLDFENAWSKLDAGRKDWLREAIQKMYGPRHQWVRKMEVLDSDPV